VVINESPATSSRHAKMPTESLVGLGASENVDADGVASRRRNASQVIELPRCPVNPRGGVWLVQQRKQCISKDFVSRRTSRQTRPVSWNGGLLRCLVSRCKLNLII
jgi:hypothetical protein